MSDHTHTVKDDVSSFTPPDWFRSHSELMSDNLQDSVDDDPSIDTEEICERLMTDVQDSIKLFVRYLARKNPLQATQ